MLVKQAGHILWALCLLRAGIALAQGEQPDEHMVVSASRARENIAKVPSTLHVYGKEQFDQISSAGDSLGSLLSKLVPGLGTSTQSNSNYGQTLRGRDVLVVIDGIPQTENRQVSRQLNTIRSEQIERVEVISGANAAYGSGATGGVIHIFTKDYSTAPLAFDTSVGASVASKPLAASSMAYHLNQTVSGSLGSSQYLLSVGVEERKNSFDARGKQIAPEPAQTSRGDTFTKEGLFKWAYHFDKAQSLELNVQAFHELQDTEYFAVDAPYRAESGLKLKDQPLSERYQVALNYHAAASMGQDLSVTAFARHRTYRFFPFALTQPVPMVNQSESSADIYGLKTVLDSKLAEGLALTWGFDYEMDQGKQSARSYNYSAYTQSGGRIYADPSAAYDYGPAIDTQKLGLFSQLKWQISEKLNSRAGLRYELIQQKAHTFDPPLETALAKNWGSVLARVNQLEQAGQVPSGTSQTLPAVYTVTAFPGGEIDYDEEAFNLGLTYEWVAGQVLFVQSSQGYELADTARLMRDAVSPGSLLPTVAPLFKLSVTTSTTEELELSTIKTSNYEMGWRGNWAEVSSSAAIFYNQSDKTYRFNRDFTVDLLDQEKRVYGLELDAHWRAQEGLRLGTSYSRSKGEYEDKDGKRWVALSAIEVAPPKWMAYVDSSLGDRSSARIQFEQVSAYTAAKDDVQTKAYSLVDAFATSQLNPASHLQLGIHNLLNEKYKTVFHQWAEKTYGPTSGSPASGRRLSLAYRVTF